MLGFQSSKKKTSILEKTWPRNDMDAKYDPYQAPTLAYIMEMDQLVVTNTINNEVEEEDILESDDKEENKVPKTTYPKTP